MQSRHRKIKKRKILRKIDILYKFVECVACRNKYCNGIKGLVVDKYEDTIEILTIFGDIVKIRVDECWYYVRIKNFEYLINPRQII